MKFFANLQINTLQCLVNFLSDLLDPAFYTSFLAQLTIRLAVTALDSATIVGSRTSSIPLLASRYTFNILEFITYLIISFITNY